MNLADIRSRLAGLEGRKYWRSLEELADTPDFREYVQREFPAQASEFSDPAGRRDFLRLMGASLALAGVSACTRQPEEHIVPYVRQPEEIVPGRPLFFATAMPQGGFGYPVLAENHMGRPTKLEGNPDHPASLGATELFSQTGILGLYDPDRSRTILHRGEIKTWGTFLAAMQAIAVAQRGIQGQTLRILTEPITSPTLAAQIKTLLADLPEARWHQWDPVYGTCQDGAPSAASIYRFDKADVVLSLDSDFLGFGPGSVRYTKDFSSRRRMGTPEDALNRLYVAEPVPTVTGANADHRLALKSRDIHAFAAAVATAVGAGADQPAASGTLSAEAARWASTIGADLQANKGKSAVIAGERQPAVVHALARAINDALGNSGTTVTYTAPLIESPADGSTSLATLVTDMNAGKVDVLAMFGANPVFTAPADLGFTGALDKVATRIHLGLYHDETADRCHWHIPEAHYLESWGDVRAFDGTVSIVQPLVAPLYDGRTASEVMAALSGAPPSPAVDLVKEHWTGTFTAQAAGLRGRNGQAFSGFDSFWRNALHDGFVQGTSMLGGATAPAAPASSPAPAPAPKTGMEIVFRPDPNVLDGRFANNAWLQELPKALSKVTWENIAYVSVKTAAAHGNLANGDVISVANGQGGKIQIPVWVMPGTADDTVVVHFGYGRRKAGKVGNNIGVDVFPIRTSKAPWFDGGAVIAKVGQHEPLSSVQNHFAMEGRNPVRVVTAEEYRKDPKKSIDHLGPHLKFDKAMTLYPVEHPIGKNAAHRWAMAIDLNACTGCGVCIAACVAENNIPVVGKTQVGRSREMHWLRVDTYFEGDPNAPAGTYHQPVPCMQCENAPCEVVCPVAATVHSDEGLNDMVYNRCVGTRYCSNNCPYKVRRFNFLLYADFDTPELYAQRNPDVTIRSRGVMEKCTYCVQRINLARIDAKTEGQTIADGTIKTACEQACPADAIVFGDLNQPDSRVVKMKKQERNYSLLEDLGTRPRTTYLAVVRNANPALARAAQG